MASIPTKNDHTPTPVLIVVSPDGLGLFAYLLGVFAFAFLLRSPPTWSPNHTRSICPYTLVGWQFISSRRKYTVICTIRRPTQFSRVFLETCAQSSSSPLPLQKHRSSDLNIQQNFHVTSKKISWSSENRLAFGNTTKTFP